MIAVDDERVTDVLALRAGGLARAASAASGRRDLLSSVQAVFDTRGERVIAAVTPGRQCAQFNASDSQQQAIRRIAQANDSAGHLRTA